MSWLAGGVGAALVLLVFRDIFHTVGHPEGQGSMSNFVLRSARRLSLRRGGTGPFARLVGPLALFAVIILWGVVAVIGWTLVYWPSMPAGFMWSSTPAMGGNGFVDSLYLSMVTISTLGFGDIVPTSTWLRLITPLEALFGFMLLTAAVSWILQIYPALTRRRVLAMRLSGMRRAGVAVTMKDLDSVLVPRLLDELSIGITEAGVDLRQYSETYYFRDASSEASLAAALPYAIEPGRIGATGATVDLRLGATLLNCALEQFAEVLRDRFRHTGESMPEVLAEYAFDHGYPPA